ncbi:MAG: ribonuclease P protein component [Cytophagales bacterium]|nr:ribonuclease P protein component [Cytophagales bacterium]
MIENAPKGTFTFSKSERLNKKKLIKELFSEGSSFFLYPFKVLYLPKQRSEDLPVHQVLFSVPKKRFKRAVQRNLIKRRLREAYRLNRLALQVFETHGESVLLAFVYVGKEIQPYSSLEPKLKGALERLSDKLHPANKP